MRIILQKDTKICKLLVIVLSLVIFISPLNPYFFNEISNHVYGEGKNVIECEQGEILELEVYATGSIESENSQIITRFEIERDGRDYFSDLFVQDEEVINAKNLYPNEENPIQFGDSDVDYVAADIKNGRVIVSPMGGAVGTNLNNFKLFTVSYELTNNAPVGEYPINVYISYRNGISDDFEVSVSPLTIKVLESTAEMYTVTSSSSGNGSISPTETVQVASGKDQTFFIKPDSSYIIDEIFVNGETIDINAAIENVTLVYNPHMSRWEYTLKNITSNAVIHVNFVKSHNITVIQTANGTITPDNSAVKEGQDQAFTITPNEGYVIDSIKVDNAEVDKEDLNISDDAGTYIFENVTVPHNITATFKSAISLEYDQDESGHLYFGNYYRYDQNVNPEMKSVTIKNDSSKTVTFKTFDIPEPYYVENAAALNGTTIDANSSKIINIGVKSEKLTAGNNIKNIKISVGSSNYSLTAGTGSNYKIFADFGEHGTITIKPNDANGTTITGPNKTYGKGEAAEYQMMTTSIYNNPDFYSLYVQGDPGYAITSLTAIHVNENGVTHSAIYHDESDPRYKYNYPGRYLGKNKIIIGAAWIFNNHNLERKNNNYKNNGEGDIYIKGEFSPTKYTFPINAPENGSVTLQAIDGGEMSNVDIPAFSDVKFVFTPNKGYRVASVKDGNKELAPDTDYIIKDGEAHYIVENITAVHDVTAEFERSEYNVSFDVSGGMPSNITPVSVKWGYNYAFFADDYDNKLPVPTRDNYEFAGWYIEPDGKDVIESTKITDETEVKLSYDHTLKAQWQGAERIIKFDPNGGFTDTSYMKVAFGEKIGKLPVPSKTGYKFEGWYDGDTLINGNYVIEFTELKTLTAKWSKVANYMVTLNPNGGKTPVKKIAVSKNGAYKGLPTLSKSGYSFRGWFTAPKGGQKVINGQKVIVNANDTLYAQWMGASNYLKKMKTSKSKLNKKFKKNRYNYKVKLNKKQKSTKITVAKAQNTTKVQIKLGKAKYKTRNYINVKVKRGKSKIVYIKVTAENGKFKTYKIRVSRAKYIF